MAKRKAFPTPKKRYHNRAWELYWYWRDQRFSVSPQVAGEGSEVEAEIALRQLAVILSRDDEPFPPEWANTPGVRRYLAMKYPNSDTLKAPVISPGMALSDYHGNLYGNCSKSWADTSMSRLRQLDAATPGGILKTTAAQADQFITGIKTVGLSTGTRNRSLAICSRFFKWAVQTGRVTSNPFEGIRSIKESTSDEIVYCTIQERARILSVAENLDREDWIAIPIAFYAGCRRAELWALRWEDINLESRRIAIRKSKTGHPRVTPIAKELMEILDGRKQSHGPVLTVPKGMTWENQSDRIIEMVREVLCRPMTPDATGRPAEVVGKRLFLNTPEELRNVAADIAKAEKAYEKMKPGARKDAAAHKIEWMKACPNVAHDGSEWIPAERIRWNSFRHTFATLRVQAGVALDKVSAWMGNTPDVCRRHYAQFVPRDAHDEDIDR